MCGHQCRDFLSSFYPFGSLAQTLTAVQPQMKQKNSLQCGVDMVVPPLIGRNLEQDQTPLGYLVNTIKNIFLFRMTAFSLKQQL